jgi:hypothetical protein
VIEQQGRRSRNGISDPDPSPDLRRLSREFPCTRVLYMVHDGWQTAAMPCQSRRQKAEGRQQTDSSRKLQQPSQQQLVEARSWALGRPGRGLHTTASGPHPHRPAPAHSSH